MCRHNLYWLLLTSVVSPWLIAQPTNPDFTIGLSMGQGGSGLVWAHDASVTDPNYGNPTSLLAYKGIRSRPLGLQLNRHWQDGRGLRLWLSQAVLDGGQLRDQDWYSTAYASSLAGPTLFSDTQSELGQGSQFDLAATLRLPVTQFDAGPAFWLLQSRLVDETYHAYGATLLADPYSLYGVLPGEALIDDAEAAISQHTRFYSMGVGVGVDKALSSRMQLWIELIASPIVSIRGDDVHHQRTDLGRPSVIHQAIGQGVSGQIEGRWAINQQWSATLGYQTNQVSLQSGDAYILSFTGYASGPYPLRRFGYQSNRLTLGLEYALAANER